MALSTKCLAPITNPFNSVLIEINDITGKSHNIKPIRMGGTLTPTEEN